jgi:hypothetical protein
MSKNVKITWNDKKFWNRVDSTVMESLMHYSKTRDAAVVWCFMSKSVELGEVQWPGLQFSRIMERISSLEAKYICTTILIKRQCCSL